MYIVQWQVDLNFGQTHPHFSCYDISLTGVGMYVKDLKKKFLVIKNGGISRWTLRSSADFKIMFLRIETHWDIKYLTRTGEEGGN